MEKKFEKIISKIERQNQKSKETKDKGLIENILKNFRKILVLSWVN